MCVVVFKSGDQVRLKSGGPVMTIAGKDERRSPIGNWHVRWFTSEGELKEESFKSSSLEYFEDDDLK